MHRVGIAGSASSSVRPRKEKRFTYVLNDADDTKVSYHLIKPSLSVRKKFLEVCT